MQAINSTTEETAFSSKDRLLIGTLFAKENPEKAKTYLDNYSLAKQKALDSDLHNLNFYFLYFCKRQNIDAFEYIGALSKREKIDKRRLFIGAMLRIYKPQLFSFNVPFDIGIGQSLCIVLKMDNGNMTRFIDEIKTWYTKDYCGYRQEVDNIVQELMDGKNGYNENLFKVA